MTITESRICTVAVPGNPDSEPVEVVTEQAEGGSWTSTVHGGRLDGDRFTFGADADVESEHARACRLVRMASWPRRERGRRR